jgi:hypothetical protein
LLPSRPSLAFLPLLALLAACDNAAIAPDDDAARAASGEVLEGSISDDMLPLEDLTSQPPIAPPLPGETVEIPASGAAAPAVPASRPAEAAAAEAAEAPAPVVETP